MGYRSEVVLVVGKELMPFFLHKISGCNPAQVMCFQDADHMENDYDNEGATLFHWNQIKWYESWPEVATVQSFKKTLKMSDLVFTMFLFQGQLIFKSGRGIGINLSR